MQNGCYYIGSRPLLTIESKGGSNLGRCYSASYYQITSKQRVSLTQIHALRDAGFLGYGQEFYVKSKCDGTEEPAGSDEVACVEFINGVAQPGPAINPYTQKPYQPMIVPYFVYDIERRVDSGD